MKCLNFVAVLLFMSSQVFGQSALDDAKKEIDKENYVRAKNILRKALADGSVDKLQASYYLGNAYLRLDDSDSAKICYRVLGAQNKSPLGYLANGRLSLLNGDIAKAKEAFDMAATKSGMKNSETLYQAGDALFRPSVTDLKQALDYFESAYKLDATNYTNTLELGDAYLVNNEGGKAMSKYQSAADVNNKLTLAYIKMGRLNVSSRIYDDAIASYKKAIELEPDYALAHKELAEAYYLSKKYDLAKPEFKKYIDLNKDDADAKVKFITFLYQIKEYDQCASEAQKMLLDDPGNFLLLRAMIYCNYELKRYKEGVDYSQRFWVAAPVSKVKPLDYVYTAKIATKSGDTALAFKYFAKALSVDSSSGELLSDYAQMMYTSKRYGEAISYYKRKISKFPVPFNFYDQYYLGRSYYAMATAFRTKKDDVVSRDSANICYVAADSAFAQITGNSFYTTTPDGWQYRAKCNSYLDPEMKTGAAKPYYEEFVKQVGNSKDPSKYKKGMIDAYDYLGSYYANSKDIATAKTWLNKALELDPNDDFTKELLNSLK